MSRTWNQSTPNVFRKTSGASDEPPIPNEDDVVDGVVQRLGEAADLVELALHAEGLVEPAEPLRLVLAGPRGRVARPNLLDQAAGRHVRR